ncbi:MAG TPA: hypothetical protein VKR06_36530 [Ktedonosporobacter sp.]|nr:hypothetical protein [Ktedonosporobacter sp.]
MVPQDDFTPFGYLDNPYHFWKLNPSGVVNGISGVDDSISLGHARKFVGRVELVLRPPVDGQTAAEA